MEIVDSKYFDEIVSLLADMVRIPSFSREEGPVADLVERWLSEHGLAPHRVGNNVWLDSDDSAASHDVYVTGEGGRRTILLNAHIDTVRPAGGYTRDPFTPVIDDGKMYGLATNDDGASFAATLAAYLILVSKPQEYRLIWSATAEEEVCGKGGIEAAFPFWGDIDLGIIGEPTGMAMAVAEKGLMVLDCIAEGKSGHAAREEGINAIYKAIPDIEWFMTYRFPKLSPYLGEVKMSVTQINAGTQHNIVPDLCSFVVDVRSNGMYSNPELLALIKSSVSCTVRERSTRLGSSHIDPGHPIVRRAESMGIPLFGSSTTSNQTLSHFPTVKMGPGDSARSHTADEYIYIEEIRQGIMGYVALLDGFEF